MVSYNPAFEMPATREAAIEQRCAAVQEQTQYKAPRRLGEGDERATRGRREGARDSSPANHGAIIQARPPCSLDLHAAALVQSICHLFGMGICTSSGVLLADPDFQTGGTARLTTRRRVSLRLNASSRADALGVGAQLNQNTRRGPGSTEGPGPQTRLLANCQWQPSKVGEQSKLRSTATLWAGTSRLSLKP